MNIEADQFLQSLDLWLTFLSLKAVVIGLGVNDEGEAICVATCAVLPHIDLRAQVGVGVEIDLEKKKKSHICHKIFHLFLCMSIRKNMGTPPPWNLK